MAEKQNQKIDKKGDSSTLYSEQQKCETLKAHTKKQTSKKGWDSTKQQIRWSDPNKGKQQHNNNHLNHTWAQYVLIVNQQRHSQ